MLNFFDHKDTKKSNCLDEIINRNLMCYVDYMKDNYRISGINMNDEEKQKLMSEYEDSVNYFKGYLESTFSDEILSNGNALDINVEEMLKEAPYHTRSLFLEHTYNGLIYINNGNGFPHMHTDGKNVIEMEGVHLLKGLNRKLQDNRINAIFTGFRVDEALALLEQMGLVYEQSELRNAVIVHDNYREIRLLFLRAIIYSLLNSESEYRIIRARLFADSFGIDFDFSKYEEEIKQEKELKKVKDC